MYAFAVLRAGNKMRENNNMENAERAGSGKKRFHHWEFVAFYLLVYDILAVNIAYFVALWLRFDLKYSMIPADYMAAFIKFAPIYTVFSILVFFVLRLYRSLWRFAGFSELNHIFVASVITTAFHCVGITILFKRMPISYYMMGAVIQFGMITVVRFSYRYITMQRARRAKEQLALHNAMIIGAGAAGQVIIRELKNSAESTAKPVCVIDDNVNKWGRLMEGVPIEGGRDSIMESVKKYNVDQILFAIPTAPAEERRDILNKIGRASCRERV